MAESAAQNAGDMRNLGRTAHLHDLMARMHHWRSQLVRPGSARLRPYMYEQASVLPAIAAVSVCLQSSRLSYAQCADAAE